MHKKNVKVIHSAKFVHLAMRPGSIADRAEMVALLRDLKVYERVDAETAEAAENFLRGHVVALEGLLDLDDAIYVPGNGRFAYFGRPTSVADELYLALETFFVYPETDGGYEEAGLKNLPQLMSDISVPDGPFKAPFLAWVAALTETFARYQIRA